MPILAGWAINYNSVMSVQSGWVTNYNGGMLIQAGWAITFITGGFYSLEYLLLFVHLTEPKYRDKS